MISVGSKVVRNSFPGHGSHGCTFVKPPERGRIYVVRELYLWGGKLGLRLVDHPVYWPDGTEAAWDARGFSELEHEQMRSELEYHRALPVQPPQPAPAQEAP